jgi:hypothetical protein
MRTKRGRAITGGPWIRSLRIVHNPSEAQSSPSAAPFALLVLRGNGEDTNRYYSLVSHSVSAQSSALGLALLHGVHQGQGGNDGAALADRR